LVFNCPGASIKHRADFPAQIECVKRKWSTLRFSKEIVVSNAADLKWRKSLLRLIGTRLRDAKRNQTTSEIERLQKMQTELRQAPAVPGPDHPKVRAAIHRATKTRRQAIKRKLDPKDQRLTVKKRIALLTEIRDLADIESQLFGVIHKSPKIFTEYCGRFPTPDDIIHNAVIWRCLESGKPHLILPKLAAMFPEYYAARLAEEVKRDPKARRVVHRINAENRWARRSAFFSMLGESPSSYLSNLARSSSILFPILIKFRTKIDFSQGNRSADSSFRLAWRQEHREFFKPKPCG
jgi:hypothetical protein